MVEWSGVDSRWVERLSGGNNKKWSGDAKVAVVVVVVNEDNY